MPQERLLVSATQIYTSRWLAIQEYAKTHPRITGGHEKIGQCITASVLADFRDQVKGVLGRDEGFSAEPAPVQEWNIDQEVIKKFWAEQGLTDLKREVINMPKEQSRNLTPSVETYDAAPAFPPQTHQQRGPSVQNESQSASTYVPQQRRFSAREDNESMPAPSQTQARKVPQHLKSSLDPDNDTQSYAPQQRRFSSQDDSHDMPAPTHTATRKVPLHLKSSFDYDEFEDQHMAFRAPNTRKPPYQDDSVAMPPPRNQPSPVKNQSSSSSPSKRDLYRSWGGDDDM